MGTNGLRQGIISVVLFLLAVSANAQTIVRGVIRDAVSGQPMPFVSVYFKGMGGINSGADGSYKVQTSSTQVKTIEFSYVGYDKITRTIKPGVDQVIDIDLRQSGTLDAVLVTRKNKARYRNKDNPAVELIRKVIDNKSRNRLTAHDYVSYQQYEKMELSLTNKPEKLMKNKLLKKYQFVLENRDSTKVPGKSLLPVYLEEILSEKYFRKNPEKNKTVVLGEKKVNFGEFVDNDGVSKYLNSMYQDIDVYENNITLLSNQFLSPIADLSPTFYMFFIKDTVVEDGIQLVKLYFSPRNPNDLLFKGALYITLDGNYAVQKINMDISKHANLNWTKSLLIDQDFEKTADGRYHMKRSSMQAEFAFSKNASGGILGERTVSIKNFTVDHPIADSVFNGPALATASSPASTTDSFWQAGRHQPLTAVESNVYANIDSLTHMRSYRKMADWATLLLAGYKSAGPFDIGPVNAFYSFNPVEGFRLRAGGRTTPKFNNRLYFETYGAYGFKDEKWKYFLSGTYSFNRKSIYSFPLNYLRVSYQYDTKIPGQELQFVQEDNFLLSFKRGNNDKWLYNNIFKIDYVREFGKNISYSIGFKNWKQTPAGAIEYVKPEGPALATVPDVTTSELSAELRWAPNEKFYQGKSYRIPVANKYPIFRFRYIAGIKGLVNGEYNYHNLNLNIFKRVYLSQFGFIDVTLDGGYIMGTLPYPLLNIHRANQTYSYQSNSYNLMNFMEFVSDHYGAVNMDYYFNGFLFNKIPGIKKLKLREVASAKILYGGLRKENDPAYTSDMFQFPVDKTTGQATTFGLGNQPYIEVSVGIANIFKILRVDFVKRVTYLDHPDIADWGIRGKVKFEF